MKRIDQVVELAARVAEARATAARLEAELQELLGGADVPRDPKPEKVRPPPGETARKLPRAHLRAGRKRGRKPGPVHLKVVDLARQGIAQGNIAGKLGIATGTVGGHLRRARRDGELEPDPSPKAGAAPARAATMNGTSS